MTDAGALLHSCAVYLYLYDRNSGSYTQQTDAAVGCALLANDSNSDAFSLLFYDTQKSPLLQLPLTPNTRFVPQNDNYVNFYERKTQRNFAMRFRDADSSEKFLLAVALVKAQVFVHSAKAFDRSKPLVLVDQLALGKDDASPLTLGDVAGLALKKWQGCAKDRENFFSAINSPLEIRNQKTTDATGEGEVRPIRLIDAEDDDMDPFLHVLATEALLGMQKTAKRLVTVTFPNTQQWVIAQIELVKVKKNTKSSATSEQTANTGMVPTGDEAQGHDDLVKRMASLSRMGSESSGLIASVKTRLDSREANESSVRQESSDPPTGYVPVLLAGLQLPGERPGSFRSSNVENGEVQSNAVSDTQMSSLAAKVIELSKFSSETDVSGSKLTSLSSDMERLMKEQSDLARLREQLEESKRKLQSDDDSTVRSPPKNGSSGHSATLTEYKPAQDASSFTPSSFARMGSSAPTGTGSSYGSSTSRWTPPKIDLVPSFSPSTFAPPSTIPPAPSSFSSSLTPYTNHSFSSYSSTQGVSESGSSPDVETGIIRLQRSSTSIESTLQEVQSKMDRLLNMQNSMKSGTFVSSSSKYSAGTSFSPASSSSSSTSSSSMLLKNLEKALAQRDQLQDINARLQEANGELESTVEDCQSQQESLQMENRTLLDKLQNGNHLQQEKFRLELRSVQQQLNHTQEQMLVYQEENFHLRSELAAKDEQLAKEKAKLQEDTHKQLGQLQRQVEEKVQQGSKDSIERMATEKAALEAQVAELTALKKQWDVERETMNNRLSQAQSQQMQLEDESAKSHTAQNSRVQELMARVQHLENESRVLKQQAEGSHSEAQHLEELLASKEQEMTQLQSAQNDQEYAALRELFKEFMNDIYFHFQDAFDEDTEFTGKEIVMAIRKILKQNTMEILAKLEEFYKQQALLCR